MATRRPPGTSDGALAEGVRSLYVVGVTAVAVGAVATALALAARVATGHSIASAAGTVLDAAGRAASAIGGGEPGLFASGEPAVLGLGVLALAAGCWLVGAALLVDGVREP